MLLHGHLLQVDAVDPGTVCYKAKSQTTHHGGGPKALHQELGVDVLTQHIFDICNLQVRESGGWQGRQGKL